MEESLEGNLTWGLITSKYQQILEQMWQNEFGFYNKTMIQNFKIYHELLQEMQAEAIGIYTEYTVVR